MTLEIATGKRWYIDVAVSVALAAVTSLPNLDGILLETNTCELNEAHCVGMATSSKACFSQSIAPLSSYIPT